MNTQNTFSLVATQIALTVALSGIAGTALFIAADFATRGVIA